MLAKRASGIHAPGFQGAGRQHPEGRAAADVGDLEPDALFSADRDRGDVAVRLPPEPLQGLDRDQTGNDTCRSIKVAAVGNRIEMRAGHEARRSSILAGQGHEKVGGVIAARFEPHGVRLGRDQLMCELLARPVSVTRYPIAVAAAGPQGIEERPNVRLLRHYGVADLRAGKQGSSPLLASA